MLGKEEKDRHAGVAAATARKPYLRSVSWTDRSPTKPKPKPPQNTKWRSCLPPLSITRRPVEEWPKAGSDDLGVWPNPQTPRGSVKPLESPGSSREFQLRRDKLAFYDKECSRIADHIYLGGDAVAKNREILRKNEITHVLNCVGFVCPEYFKNDLVYKTLWLQDSPSEDITSILYDVFDYFEDVREQGGRVLVHCCQGVSRSTSLVIAYLMWREGQSFEDAFQYVKAARGVTNPNTGFAFQLLLCQKRVHAVPASPNSMLRMYRMAPHSSYDPLHLVPKMLNHPGKQGLDSRGAFIVHVPSAVYVWIGKKCNHAMSSSAGLAANQVIRYERAQGPILTVREGEESLEFWDALAIGQLSADGCDRAEVRKLDNLASENDKMAAANKIYVVGRKVEDYDLDFELFHKALAGGVVPPFSISTTESETCLPARENGWGRLRQKFANGIMKEIFNSSKLGCNLTLVSDRSDTVIEVHRDSEDNISLSSPSPSIFPCGSPDSFDCFPDISPIRRKDPCEEVEQTVTPSDSPLAPRSPCGSPNSFSCFAASSPKFSSKSPTLSPSTSDYASSFAFSPSSSNWSDLSYLSSRQPSPSALEASDLFTIKSVSSPDNSCLPCNGSFPSPTKTFSSDLTLRVANTCVPSKGTSPSIAERRWSHPPPRMLLPSVDEPIPRKLVRPWSYAIPELDDDEMNEMDYNQYEPEDNREELMLDAEAIGASIESHSGTQDKREYGECHPQFGSIFEKGSGVTTLALYQWPTLNKVEIHGSHILEPGAVYMLLAPEASLGASDHSGVLYVWHGREVLSEKGPSQFVSCDGVDKDNYPCWESIARDFLNKMDLPPNVSIQIVTEGQEPEQFLNLFNCFIIPEG
ncbi:protein-tyrosine-phosphatase MKP1-like [Durio zibethinus]|uniref:Protein-tyrosine-phosphatase MKP1-like n=1 Tax=Durio zibethinus TaxID=66656 RepID=A0A6P5Y4K1_DURZI|nr:protein-tyrosine-phosphatase MKP1-like [Durio zibethinus]